MHSRSSFVRRPEPLVVAYLLALVAANLLAARFGPGVTVLNAFLFIGLDLSTRDQLHARWQGRRLWPRMLLLIGSGGLLAFLLGGSGHIAIASSLAFIAAGSADALVYHALGRHARLVRINGSNLAGAIVDSLLFPLLAFGWPLSWAIVLGHILAKVVGGALWAHVLTSHRRAPQHVGASEGGRRSGR
ncbi:MAG: hypothetical protein OHK0015_36130 [Chloroflexi bacterium OHK40]